MVFATASSLNGSLNIAAGVFTNDIYKRLKPEAPNEKLMKIARYSTIGFGLLAIVVALLIPLMGGIVNVVISVAALTGVPLYLPLIWSLFSKRQNATTVLSATLISLGINAFFKFAAPLLFNISLDRATEMLVGALVPVLLMLLFELYLRMKDHYDPKYDSFTLWRQNREKEQEAEKKTSTTSSDNKQSYRVIGLGIGLSGIAIFILGLLASGFARLIVLGISALLIAFGLWIVLKLKKRPSNP
jgi:Na+/proline symporter